MWIRVLSDGEFLDAQSSARPSKSRAEEQPRQPEPQRTQSLDHHAVLGVSPDASQEEVKAAYRLRMQEYHPDKVAHLGPELRILAERKAKEINEAYRILSR